MAVSEVEVRAALAHLLEREGVPCPDDTDAYAAKARPCGVGGPLYVIVAAPGMDAELGKIISAATARHRGSTCGIWVLAERDASDLVKYSSVR
jgi:hypothetical protein